jgi:DNA-directed RNA polymerase subunit RPC12/RpoP
VIVIECDKCAGRVEVDSTKTLDDYVDNLKCIVDRKGKLVEDTILPYLIYKCIKCGKIYKFTYKEWEKRMRIQLSKIAMELRKKKMFGSNTELLSIDPDSGLDYCGQCTGYDGDGNCLVDIIKQCSLRRV